MKKVIAVVVTYNRKELLLECLDSILTQTYDVSKIILINNASTDGTEALLKEQGYLDHEKINYILMNKNTGGSGGFYEGIKCALECDSDWVWLMDDDTIPKEDCLYKLINAYDILDKNESSKIAYLASSIYGPDNEFMNVPTINYKPSENGYCYWYKYLSDKMVNIESATFVSVLINRDAIIKCGLPCKDYFIWGDDTEYTTRLTHYYGEGFFVGDSIAIHKRIGAKELKIENETNANRIKMFHFYYRNTIINNRFYNKSRHYYISCVLNCLKSLKYYKFKNGHVMSKAIIYGNIEALTQYKKFEKYIKNQLNL